MTHHATQGWELQATDINKEHERRRNAWKYLGRTRKTTQHINIDKEKYYKKKETGMLNQRPSVTTQGWELQATDINKGEGGREKKRERERERERGGGEK